VKTSLFTTGLRALDLRGAIQATAAAGYDSVELGCFEPHLTLDVAEGRTAEVVGWLNEAGLPVSALSLVVSYTEPDEAVWRANVEETCRFIRLCGRLGTRIVKSMPGPPASAAAGEEHWERFRRAMDAVLPVARTEGVRLAIETHLNHLSDTIRTSLRCMECGEPDVLGVTLDFCNIHTCGESALDAIDALGERIFFTHVKDSLFSTASGEYVPVGEGRMDYVPIIRRLRAMGYDGYLSVECLYGPQDGEVAPAAGAEHDLGVLRGLLDGGAGAA